MQAEQIGKWLLVSGHFPRSALELGVFAAYRLRVKS